VLRQTISDRIGVVSLLQYEANKMHSEALNIYNLLINSKIYVNNGKLQVNVGNIYYEMGNYEKAVKFYKMALDKVIKTQKSNIAVADQDE